MKTKYYLTAMCLPLAFAACTNEEIETIDNGLAGREVVKMALSANYGTDGAESRMVNNNGTFLWDNTDVLGAAMPNLLTDGVYSNNRFGNSLTEPSAAADFTTQSTTIAGEYTFYYPYSGNVTKNPNGGITYSLPAVQEYDPTGVKMMNNNFMVAPRITVDGKEPGTLTLPITMRSIYSYGLLNLKLADNVTSNYANVTDVNIQKIIIEYTSNVYEDGQIDLNVLPTADITTGHLTGIQTGAYGGSYYPSLKNKDLAEIRAALLAEADAKLVGTSTVYADGSKVLALTKKGQQQNAPDTKIAKVAISCVDAQNPNGVALSKGGEFSTRILLPTTANAGTVTVTVYTNKGKKVINATPVGDGVMKAGHTVNLANINRTGDATALYISEALNTTDNTVEAISEADFIASMKQYAGLNAPAISVGIHGFNLTPNAIAAIPTTATITFTTDVTFEGDMTLKNMSFASKNVTFKSGTIVLESILASGDAASYTIKKDADVTFKALTTANASAVTIDGGKLTIEKYNASNAPVKQYVGSIEVTNGGSLIVNTPLEASASVTVGTSTNGNTGSLENNSTINTLSVDQTGSVENNGTVGVLTNSGSVANNGKINGGTNAGYIYQMLQTSVVTLDTNIGRIETVAYSQTTVTKNDGNIIFVENARVKADKNVAYEVPASFKASDLNGLVAAITKLIFTEDFTYDYELDDNGTAVNNDHLMTNTNVTSLEFQGNLTLAKSWGLKDNSTVSFTGAKANVTGVNKSLTGNNLSLSAGVPESWAGAGNNVATDLFIGNKLTIETVKSVALVGGAKVWNEGLVKGTSTVATPSAWAGNDIEGTVRTELALKDALTSATDGSTIVLDGEIALVTPLTISKNVTIKGGTISGKAVTVSSSAEVTFDGVTFKDVTNANNDASSIYFNNATNDITIKDCTFEGFQWDAIQITPAERAGKIVISGCAFNAESAVRYIHIQADKVKGTNAVIEIINNKFGSSDAVNNSMIDVDFIINWNQVIVGGNKFVNTKDEIIANSDIYVCGNDDNNDDKFDTYDFGKAYDAFTAATAANLK